MSFIILGLAFVASELRIMRRNMQILLNTDKTASTLRKLRLIVTHMNQAFRSYLMWFSPILYALVGLLLFGSIRVLHTDFLTNSMFPVCGMRCVFEATTPLAMAGNVSQESEKVLELWREKMVTVTKWVRSRKMIGMVQRASGRILCTAGSLYTFENSICCRKAPYSRDPRSTDSTVSASTLTAICSDPSLLHIKKSASFSTLEGSV
ncbi:hypothetical protein Ocin01_07658 [Orchesella cincta]|uniref:Uncharacterized protein n=1 Tax=Orchesella cincta TaxID=48709 RepID=A0A1D2N193_ORCCI|nr:hypothetical protein Ocin01_07658 [Orchesella cincta]